VYSCALPANIRSKRGVFFTPPVLTTRLINSVTSQGLNWKTARILDTSCGGAAFLAPIALEMRRHLLGQDAAAVLKSICNRLRGFEIDSFSAWLSQTLLEIALSDLCILAKRRLPSLVTVQDTLTAPVDDLFDLVIGNPPYGRCSLSKEMRERYSKSLYGHANMYGVFTQAALNWTAANGLIAYVTPTSMLGGKYFQALRALLLTEAPPVAIDFIDQRTGVFESVLQETMLATYRKGASTCPVLVHFLDLKNEFSLDARKAGSYPIGDPTGDPWLLPRSLQQRTLVGRLAIMPTRLKDYGYKVSTGPMVFHRYKKQLRTVLNPGSYPVLCAETVKASGVFDWRPATFHYKPFFVPRKKDQLLIRRGGYILVQRTTSKEQKRRLIAAELPPSFVARHRGVIVENHLNMVLASVKHPAISIAVLLAILHSEIADAAFRCINGSVAVSASELEALPLPTVSQAAALEDLINRGAGQKEIDEELERMYFSDVDDLKIAKVA
jgi:adenine-specific DNA-methyltransferase